MGSIANKRYGGGRGGVSVFNSQRNKQIKAGKEKEAEGADWGRDSGWKGGARTQRGVKGTDRKVSQKRVRKKKKTKKGQRRWGLSRKGAVCGRETDSRKKGQEGLD